MNLRSFGAKGMSGRSVLRNLPHRSNIIGRWESRGTAPGMQTWKSQGYRATAEVFSTGAMVHHLEFDLANGRRFRPLAEAPWLEVYLGCVDAKPPSHVQLLGGKSRLAFERKAA